MLAHVDRGWERHSRHQLTQVWDSPELAGRVFDAYLCVTEYVLTAGDPYDRVAGFAKRLRAQAQQAGARRGEAFATTVLGETELFTGSLEAARAHLVDAARLSREVGAVGGESLARLRLGETLLHLGDRAGARAQLEEALELAHISPLAEHLVFLVCGVLLQVPEEDAEALALIERAETLFDPVWVCPFCPTGYHVAAATVCARAGQLERSREFLRRAEFGAEALAGRPLAGRGGGGAGQAAARRRRPAGRRVRPAPRRRGLRRGRAAAQRAPRARNAGTAPHSEHQRLGRFREGVSATLPACTPTTTYRPLGAWIPRPPMTRSRRCPTAAWPPRSRERPLPTPAAQRGPRLPAALRPWHELVRRQGLRPRPRAAAPRLTLERQTRIHITPVERNHHVPVPVPPTHARQARWLRQHRAQPEPEHSAHGVSLSRSIQYWPTARRAVERPCHDTSSTTYRELDQRTADGWRLRSNGTP